MKKTAKKAIGLGGGGVPEVAFDQETKLPLPWRQEEKAGVLKPRRDLAGRLCFACPSSLLFCQEKL